ncbi:MAG TPA: GNAT family N-acetyltransferase [Pirellulales bacterium]|jgi:GNAT superfamily N-acetyltransferase|nr:GNAT family N-acetyltransferase [Pirellulales bacterium]
MPNWDIERLQNVHVRDSFDFGNAALDDWLKRYATQFERRNLARTFVATRPPATTVLGYFALSNHAIRCESFAAEQAKGLPRIDIQVVLLGRLAVSRTEQGQGLGSFLLIDALRRSLLLSEQIGVRAVEVVAIDDAARNFYIHFGFTPLEDDPNHLIMPIQAIRRLGP